MTTTEPTGFLTSDQIDALDQMGATIVDVPHGTATIAGEPAEVLDPEVLRILTPEAAAPLPDTIAKMVPGLEDIPIVPGRTEFEGLCQMAIALSNSSLVPAALRGKPQDCLLVLLTARDLGIALTTAFRECHVIDGKITISPKLKDAMVRIRSLGKVWPHQPPRPQPDGTVILCACGGNYTTDLTREAEWHAERFDQPGLVYTGYYSMEMAGTVSVPQRIREGNNTRTVDGSLLDKDNWRNYGHQMIKWRAKGYLFDDAFPEVATGIYSPDEMGAVTNEMGEPITVTSVEDPFAGKSGPPARQPPSDPEPNPDQFKDLADRIAVITRNPAAKAAMAEAWMKMTPRADGVEQPRLPPFRSPEFRNRHMVVASAIVGDFERRLAKGEFALSPSNGEEAPEATTVASDPAEPTTDAEGTDPAEPGEPAETMGEYHARMQAEREAAMTPEELEDLRVAGCAAYVKALDLRAVVAMLGIRQLSTTGQPDTQRKRLCQALLDTGWQRGDRVDTAAGLTGQDT